MFDRQNIRHPDCTKLILHYDCEYQGYPVLRPGEGPLIAQYLDSSLQTIHKAFMDYGRLFAFRVDLRYPANMNHQPMHDDNRVLKNFFGYFSYELQRLNTKYRSKVRYIWAREKNHSHLPHYHLMFLLNYDAFNSLGSAEQSPGGGYFGDNMYHRLVRSWAKAIDWPLEQMGGLVHICQSPDTGQWSQCVIRGDAQGMNELVRTASYLCKAHTKYFGQRSHNFGASRV
ncbi:YagK/YfjJ domain-containing protein [Ectothiorhodospira haloalkaliphila]|uniref:YagK/YfjJ domain-containing protein n=1 Tax=Ectothiorhodospira haloalkaliphila TaxID=421628 RepID=UPI00055199CA|nr:inovirus-type Gp2 protein [Ectothiorhodospira haloalkaliphila]